MKVQLIVVQGKPEGKSITLTGPCFKIGRGENCNLRPNSEMVSREHVEIVISPDQVTVKDLGSRNGTQLNGKPVTQEQALSNGDLIHVGPLTFAVSIEGAPAPAGRPKTGKPASLDEVPQDDIEAWLIADEANPTPDRPSGIYKGDTMTLASYQAIKDPKPPEDETSSSDEPGADEEPEAEDAQAEDAEAEDADEMPEEFIDESNPFYAAKKADTQAAPPKPSVDSSDAADQILRRMMDRRRSR